MMTETYLLLQDFQTYEKCTEERIIEYAGNRLFANEDDRNDFSFDTYSMTIEQATLVIESYNEEVIPYGK